MQHFVQILFNNMSNVFEILSTTFKISCYLSVCAKQLTWKKTDQESIKSRTVKGNGGFDINKVILISILQ